MSHILYISHSHALCTNISHTLCNIIKYIGCENVYIMCQTGCASHSHTLCTNISHTLCTNISHTLCNIIRYIGCENFQIMSQIGCEDLCTSYSLTPYICTICILTPYIHITPYKSPHPIYLRPHTLILTPYISQAARRKRSRCAHCKTYGIVAPCPHSVERSPARCHFHRVCE